MPKGKQKQLLVSGGDRFCVHRFVTEGKATARVHADVPDSPVKTIIKQRCTKCGAVRIRRRIV